MLSLMKIRSCSFAFILVLFFASAGLSPAASLTMTPDPVVIDRTETTGDYFSLSLQDSSIDELTTLNLHALFTGHYGAIIHFTQTDLFTIPITSAEITGYSSGSPVPTVSISSTGSINLDRIFEPITGTIDFLVTLPGAPSIVFIDFNCGDCEAVRADFRLPEIQTMPLFALPIVGWIAMRRRYRASRSACIALIAFFMPRVSEAESQYVLPLQVWVNQAIIDTAGAAHQGISLRLATPSRAALTEHPIPELVRGRLFVLSVSGESRWISGTVLPIDGGLLCTTSQTRLPPLADREPDPEPSV